MVPNVSAFFLPMMFAINSQALDYRKQVLVVWLSLVKQKALGYYRKRCARMVCAKHLLVVSWKCSISMRLTIYFLAFY